jgi:radical SAM superfamily enzyme YgiQ (UPF0313 family)
MKCALIIPAWVPEEIFSSKTVNSQSNYWQPLGTLYVAACLRRAGHEVRFFNGGMMAHGEILDQVRAFSPAFVGIYSTTFGWPKALKTARAVKEIDQEIFVCAGGPYPIALQERCLDLPEAGGGAIDAVITGEGEETVVELAERLERGQDLRGVLGVAYREGDRVEKNPPRPLIEKLDTLPFPARDLLGDASRYIPPPGTYRRKPVSVLITSRGCDSRCIFCFQIDRGRKGGARGIRYRSIDNVLQEIEHCLREGYREIKFLDDTLTADYDRAMDLARAIKARRLDFTWFASACVNQVDEPLLRAFKEAGCWAILLGAESGVQRHLNTLRKGFTLEHTRQAVRAAKAAGLKVSTPFIFGIPGETYEDGLRTIAFALELDPDLANFHALTPFPGTDLYDRREKYGTVSGDHRDFTYQGAAFVPHTMTREEIAGLRQLAFKRFYGRPAFLLRKLLEIRTLHDAGVALKSLKSLFWLWTKRDLFVRKKRGTASPAGEPVRAADTP